MNKMSKEGNLRIIVANASCNWASCYWLVHLGWTLGGDQHEDDGDHGGNNTHVCHDSHDPVMIMNKTKVTCM